MRLFFLIIFLIFTIPLLAQKKLNDSIISYSKVIDSVKTTKRMKLYGNTRLTLNQAHFDNWVSGGESSLSALFGLDYNFNYSSNGGLIWDSKLVLSLGITSLSDTKYSRKADDRLEIKSLVGKKISPYWNYSGFVNLKTQILSGYRYFKKEGQEQREENSHFFSPAIFQVGLGWHYKKNTDLYFNLAPLTGRIILVGTSFTQNLEEGKKYFGVDAGKSSKFFFGALVSGYFKTPLMQGITMENKYNFYMNYIENTENIDVDWKTDFRFKVNDKISSSLIIHILYDDDLIKKLQLRELFGVGINMDL